MSVQLTKVNSFVENLAEKKIDLWGAGLTVALTNTAHNASWSQLSDLTQIDYTNLSSRVLSVSSSSQTAWLYTLKLTDLVLTASWAVWPFRYVYVYDDSSTGDLLIWYYDYWMEAILNTGETFTLDFDSTEWVLTIQ